MKTPDKASTGTLPSAEKGLRGLYFGVWCYRRPTQRGFFNYFSYSLGRGILGSTRNQALYRS
jgi:hypothetical protein